MITIYHNSEITGSTWVVTFDKDYDVESCYIISKWGNYTKVVMTKKKDWLLWLFFNKDYSFTKN